MERLCTARIVKFIWIFMAFVEKIDASLNKYQQHRQERLLNRKRVYCLWQMKMLEIFLKGRSDFC